MHWTLAQDKAVTLLWKRSKEFDRPSRLSLQQFRGTVQEDKLNGCLMVHWAGMWMGIERDGYTHS